MKSKIGENGKKNMRQNLFSGIILLAVFVLVAGMTFKISALTGTTQLSMMELLGLGLLCSIIVGICMLFLLPDHLSPLQNNAVHVSAEYGYGLVDSEVYQQHHEAISELRDAVSSLAICFHQ